MRAWPPEDLGAEGFAASTNGMHLCLELCLQEGGGRGLMASFLPSLGSALLHSVSSVSLSSPSLSSFALFLSFPLPLDPSLSMAHLSGFLSLSLCLRVSPPSLKAPHTHTH